MSDALTLPQVAALAQAPVVVVDTRAPAPERVVVTIDDDPYVVAFSSHELFDGWFSPEQPRAVVRGSDMGQALPLGAGFVVDPGSDRVLVVPPFDVPRVQAAGRPFPRGHQVRAGNPDQVPDALLADLAAALDATGLVRSARWVWHQVQGQQPYAVLVVDTDEPSLPDVAAACGPALARHRTPYPVELVLLEDDGDALTWVAQHVEPFCGGPLAG